MHGITVDFPQQIPCYCRKLDISDALAYYNGGSVCYKVLGGFCDSSGWER